MPKLSKQHLLSAPERVINNRVPLENNIFSFIYTGPPTRSLCHSLGNSVTESSQSFKPTFVIFLCQEIGLAFVCGTRFKKEIIILCLLFVMKSEIVLQCIPHFTILI